VAIFQHSLPFLQSQSFQTHVGTIHRRAIGPPAHHNGTSAYSPSSTCHLPRRSNVFTAHRISSRAPLTVSRYELNLPTKRSPYPDTQARVYSSDLQTTHLAYISRSSKTTNPVSIETPVHCCERNNTACLRCYPPITLRPSSIVA
jgi:hypothetical protein